MEQPKLVDSPIVDKHQSSDRTIPNANVLVNQQGIGAQCEENKGDILEEDDAFMVSQRSDLESASAASTVMKSKEDGNADNTSASVSGLPVTDLQAFAAAQARKQALFQQFSNELFLESFTYLDRSSLDGMPLVHNRVGSIVTQSMQHLCLRQIGRVSFTAVIGVDRAAAAGDGVYLENSKRQVPVPEILPRHLPTLSFYRVSWYTSDDQEAQPDGARYFASGEVGAAHMCVMIRSSRIHLLEILIEQVELRLCLHTEFLNMFSQVSPTVCADRLQFTRCSFDEVDHHVLLSFLRSFSAVGELKITDSSMDGVPVADETLRECAELGITYLDIYNHFVDVPISPITDRAIVDYLFQKTDKKVELILHNPSITPEFALELWKAVQTSQSENEIRAAVCFTGGGQHQFPEQVQVLFDNHFNGDVDDVIKPVFVCFPPTATTWSTMSFSTKGNGEVFQHCIRFERTRLPPVVADQDQ